MKLFFIPFLAFFTAFGLIHISKPNTAVVSNRPAVSKNIVRCNPDLNVLSAYLEETDIPPMPGAGKYKWNIHSKNDSAQFYFNQGINMYYGFHIIESMASFMKAAKFDQENPMVWWARALAYGPNINDAGYTESPLAVEAIQKAKSLSTKSSVFEKALIDAMIIRYSNDVSIERGALNNKYTSLMERVYLKFPGNADAAALYADAMMLEHPWELWKVGGTPYPWTPRIREVLEKGLVKTPEHPGLNHYYIHVMEPSPFPQKAMASADRLGKLNPGLSHLVHMPSHIYLRTGFYSKGFMVNEEAVSQYKNYVSLYPGAVANEFIYRMHNEHMLVNCAMHAGRRKYSIDAAQALQKSIDTSYISIPGGIGNNMQYIYMIPTLTMVRFEDWDGLLNAAAVEKKHVYASLIWHFGRGIALTAKNSIPDAQKELAIVESLLKDSSLSEPFTPFSPAIDGATIAANLLRGSIALKENKNTEAIGYFKEAVEREKKMVYNEPRDWLLNPKNYLATAYMQAGDYKKAEITFRQDLDDNNENVWSLSGLHKALTKQNKKSEASQVLARLKKASANSDISF
jgi:tetratricopeptide (TPR) repeat protein